MAFCSSGKRNQQSTPNAESHSSRRLVVSPVSNRSSPPRRLSVRRTNFRGPIATRRFSTDTPKIAAPTLGALLNTPLRVNDPVSSGGLWGICNFDHSDDLFALPCCIAVRFQGEFISIPMSLRIRPARTIKRPRRAHEVWTRPSLWNSFQFAAR